MPETGLVRDPFEIGLWGKSNRSHRAKVHRVGCPMRGKALKHGAAVASTTEPRVNRQAAGQSCPLRSKALKHGAAVASATEPRVNRQAAGQSCPLRSKALKHGAAVTNTTVPKDDAAGSTGQGPETWGSCNKCLWRKAEMPLSGKTPTHEAAATRLRIKAAMRPWAQS